MHITDYHAKYYVHELKKRCPAGDIEGLIPTLLSAQVDLNPHQVDSALFAFKSPLSKGAVLADEVGLGKTIEAGILLSQKWAERKRKLLVIVPSSLRKQWNQELLEKFFLPSCILETGSFNKALKQGVGNPFQREKEIIICSYQFARNKSNFAGQIQWDLIVIDEAHRLRNVYKPQNKIARTLRETFKNTPKILLTATPLQNSLMELYGLTSFVDEHIFGDEKSFRNQYSLRIGSDDELYSELRNRLQPIYKRALRRQVQEHVRYTKRISITEEFTPKREEQILYEKISNYLQRENLHALPSGQRQLITLVLRKLLASSSYAIHGALTKMINRLEAILKHNLEQEENADKELSKDFESFEDTKEEWGEERLEQKLLSETDKISIQEEIKELRDFQELAVSIKENAKGETLLKALNIGFKKAKELGAKEKALIFTESRRTQNYLLRLFEKTEHAEKIVLFNGSNNDQKSKQIYEEWKIRNRDSDRVTGSRTADMRSALVDYFKNTAQIMIATEAAAEGINLQFCSLIVNYDLPWNPQRIEQRIGRCHRYGQKHDVVVVNFLNRKNEADQRVFQLLSEKFKLFEGIFGVSDEVLGSIESGVDFEKRIAEIYQKCRTSEKIQKAFDALQEELSQPIDEKMKRTRQKLIENFDEEVVDKLKAQKENSKKYLARHENRLWEVTKLVLKDNAVFDAETHSFTLNTIPFGLDVRSGPYKMGNNVKDSHIYRPGHPLAEKVIETVIGKQTEKARLIFNYNDPSIPKISILKGFVGKSGMLRLTKITVESFETEDYLIFSGATDGKEALDAEQCSRLFSLPATVSELKDFGHDERLNSLYEKEKSKVISSISKRNSKSFDEEMDKLDYWAEDRKKTLEQKLKDMDKEIKELKRAARRANSLPEKIKLQKQVNNMESKRDKEWKEFDTSKKEIEQKKDRLLDNIETRMRQNITEKVIFEIEWEIV